MPKRQTDPEIASLDSKGALLVYLLRKQGLAAVLLMGVLGFAGWYAVRQQNMVHDDLRSLASALEDVRDGIDLQLRQCGVGEAAIPPRRYIRK